MLSWYAMQQLMADRDRQAHAAAASAPLARRPDRRRLGALVRRDRRRERRPLVGNIGTQPVS